MHTLNSAKELLHSLPVEVEFAGFRSNTLRLAQSGWDLSMEQQMNPRFYGPSLRLAMRHTGAKLYAISNEVVVDYGRLSGSLQNPVAYAEYLSHVCFSIACVALDIRFAVRGEQAYGGTFASRFQAIDPFPQERIVEESIHDFKFFKVANPSIKDIIVSPDQVPELLEMVLRAQAPGQREIRARERSRKNMQAYREGFNSTKPAHSVQAQIITLAS